MSFDDLMHEISSTATRKIAANADRSTAGALVDRFGADHPTVLAVFSHPDDESFLSGGLLGAFASRGARVIVASATAGEHGTDDPDCWPPALLAERREAEFQAAITTLGCDFAFTMGVVDGTCHHIDDRLGARLVGSVVDQVRPNIVLTFGEDGVTGHQDHQAVGRWTRDAMAARSDVPVFATVAATAWSDPCIEALHTIDAFVPGYPDQSVRAGDVVVELDEDLVDIKLSALDCHASQMPRVAAALGPDRWRQLVAAEAYRPVNTAAGLLFDAEPRRTAA
ncbi:MAG: PIG-L deacetylase family protein [Acidimicrobiales bacterium]